MTTTDNLGLNLPESNDYADVAVLNQNFQKLDAQALKAQAAKTTPVDADKVPVVDSADSSKTKLILWSAIKAALSSVFAAASHTHAWSTITGKPSGFTPVTHKSTHATGGADALTASDIGAAAASHNHTKSQITDFPTAMAPTAHKSTHATDGADALTAGDIGAVTAAQVDDKISVAITGAIGGSY